MKRFFSILAFIALMQSIAIAQISPSVKANEITKEKTAVSGDQPADQLTDGPKMTFQFLDVDYGTILQGENGMREFPFINDGTEPLVIKQAKGSCGCTVPEYPREPIMPGESAVVKVRYDTKRIGPFNKNVRITTNIGEDPIVLTIKGKVDSAPAGLPEKKTSDEFGSN